jgi:simple sugar transport system permease protein
MYKQSGVAAEIVAIIEGLVIVLVAATAFLSKFRHRMTTKLSKDLLTSGGER